jgi:hypothetical protein
MRNRFTIIALITIAGVAGVMQAGAATDPCATLSSPLVGKALGDSHLAAVRSFDPRGQGPQFQRAALNGATAAQTCVASASDNPGIEMRTTIVTYPGPGAADAAMVKARTTFQNLLTQAAAGGFKGGVAQETVAGLSALVGHSSDSKVFTYTVAAAKGSSTYSVSAQSTHAIDEAAVKTLFATLTH